MVQHLIVQGSSCYIYCTSTTGCEGLNVYYYRTCVIDCDDDYMSLLPSLESQRQERKFEREKAKTQEMEKDLKCIKCNKN